jgi:multidrug efflux pump subunit AcrB
VTLDIVRQSGANTVAVIEGVKERLEKCRRSCPAT